MILTVRFVVLVAIGALLIGLSGRAAALALAGTVLMSLAAVAAAADWIWLTRGVDLEAARTCDEKLSLGAMNPIKIRLRNLSYRRLRGVVRDEYPVGFQASGNVFSIDMAPRSEIDRSYHVTPGNRGDYTFGDIYVRLHGPIGMTMRQIKYPMRCGVKVYPNLLDMRRYEIGLKRERPLQPGQRITRIHGRGTDFESLRDHVPDDELRAVDWKATARRGKLTTRQYQEEKSQNVMLVLDCGRIMGPLISGLTRLDHSINAAMMLAHVASLKGDKVGMMAFADEIIGYSPPRAGRAQTLSLLSTAYNLEDAHGDSDYYRAIPYLTRKWTRRSLVVVFTDLVDRESSRPLISQLSTLARKHVCMCVVMADPAVLEAARRPVGEPEDAFRAAAAREALQARKLAAAQLARLGAIVLDVPPEAFTPAVVDRYLDIKSRGRL